MDSAFKRYQGRTKVFMSRSESDQAFRALRANPTPAQTKRLIEHYTHLAWLIAHGFARHTDRADRADDYLQEAMLGLCVAVDKFDPEAGVSFLYYAQFWIRAYTLRHAKMFAGPVHAPDRSKLVDHPVYGVSIHHPPPGGDRAIEDQLAEEPDGTNLLADQLAEEERRILDEEIRALPPTLRDIWQGQREGLHRDEVAKRLGLKNRDAVRFRYTASFPKMKERCLKRVA